MRWFSTLVLAVVGCGTSDRPRTEGAASTLDAVVARVAATANARASAIRFAAATFPGRALRCNPGTTTYAQPATSVQVPQFAIDRKVVSCEQVTACAAAGVCDRNAKRRWCRDSRIVAPPLEIAEQYCHWVGAQLPTFAEWQRAARGLDAKARAFGDDWDGKAGCVRTVPERFETRRCPVTTSDEFEYAIENPYGGEWTRDRDCIVETDRTARPLVVPLLDDRLDKSGPGAMSAEFRCVYED